MATFSSSQITKIAIIFKTSSDVLNNRLVYFQNTITEEDKTEVVAILAEFAEVRRDYFVFTPTNSNEGFGLRSSSQKDDIIKELAGLLHCEDLVSSGNSFQSFTVRG